MEGIGYLVLFLCSLAIAILAIYISILLIRVSTSFVSLGKTLEKVEKQLQEITSPLQQTMSETDKLVEGTEEKLSEFAPLFDTIENLGTSVHTINDVCQTQLKNTSDEEIYKQAEPFIEGMKWSDAAIQLYARWKKKKQ